MYNLLVKGNGWAEGADSISESRIFEHTEPTLAGSYKRAGQADLVALAALPALFLEEGEGSQIARVGTISRARRSGGEVVIEYAYDPAVPPFTNSQIKAMSAELGIGRAEFGRTHWAVKDDDLFRVLLRTLFPRRRRPGVFQIADPENIEPTLVSAMMPFDLRFEPVNRTLKRICEKAGLRYRRADDIWENPAVMQDVVSLIDRSAVVIADCSTRNPNVFYEIGIAHTLGREVILITQSDTDIPFDLRHLRYATYLNNTQGLKALAKIIEPRLKDLV